MRAGGSAQRVAGDSGDARAADARRSHGWRAGILGLMFILYGVLAGLVVGALLGGRLEQLSEIRFRFGFLVVVALVVQIAVFSPIGDVLPAAVARGLYVASTAAVALVVLANVRLPGLPLVALGAAANLAAILANGGSMPADPGALAVAGVSIGPHTNSVIETRPALEPLTDIFAIPGWVPLANVFSIGDVLIAIGI